MLRAILQILASIAAYFSNKQLLDAGSAKKELQIKEAEDEAVAKTKEIKKRNSGLNIIELDKRLRDDFRD